MAKADDEGIPLEEYIKVKPEPLVRTKLDRGELRYTWVDADGNARASDDSGPQPPKGWWLMVLTAIDCERRLVRGCAFLEPTFPDMYFVKVYPAVTVADTPAQSHPLSVPVRHWLFGRGRTTEIGRRYTRHISRGRETFWRAALGLDPLRTHPSARQWRQDDIGDRPSGSTVRRPGSGRRS